MRTQTRTPFDGGLDPVILKLSQWADDDPSSMRRLLADVQPRALVARALDDVKGTGSSVTPRANLG